MYLSMFESFALWLESHGSSRRVALFRAGIAFSLYTLIALTSIAVLLAVVAGVAIIDWVSLHGWSIWLIAALIALAHWHIGRKLGGKNQSVEEARPSLRLWCWYIVPVLALLAVATTLAIVYAAH